MLKRFKILIALLMTFGILASSVYLVRDRIILVTKQPKLYDANPQSYLLALYSRYQLQPDINNLRYSIELLTLSDSIKPQQKTVIKSISDYLKQLPNYSEIELLKLAQKIKLKQLQPKNVAIFGIDLSSVVTEKHDQQLLLEQKIMQLQWAIHLHDAGYYNHVLATIESENLTDASDVIAQLKAANVVPPELPWQDWLQKLKGN